MAVDPKYQKELYEQLGPKIVRVEEPEFVFRGRKIILKILKKGVDKSGIA